MDQKIACPALTVRKSGTIFNPLNPEVLVNYFLVNSFSQKSFRSGAYLIAEYSDCPIWNTQISISKFRVADTFACPSHFLNALTLGHGLSITGYCRDTFASCILRE